MRSHTLWVCAVVLLCSLVHAANYYIAPNGNDGNAGTTTAAPWKTFAYAMSHTTCGDILNLMDGLYGDGTGTGKLLIENRSCTPGNPFTVRTVNQRQARISDDGLGNALFIQNSAHVILDGIVLNSTDNSQITSATGTPLRAQNSNHLTFENLLVRNVNRYSPNNHPIVLQTLTNSLVEDVEIYGFHRHGLYIGGGSSKNIVRRLYTNPRGGALVENNGGFGGVGNRLGKADGGIAFYPCVDCIAENVIADAGVTEHYLAEFNAQGPITGSKMLGSIGYKVSNNGVVIQARGNSLNQMPENNVVKDVVIWNSRGSFGVAAYAAKNITIDHVTVEGTGSSSGGSGGIVVLPSNAGIYFGDGSPSATVTNSISINWKTNGFIENQGAFTGNYLKAYNNSATNFYPALPANWGANSSVQNPALGTCVAWVPDGSPMKGAGQNGTDIGANILYRYKDGVLTNEPLWDPATGEFPHGSFDLDGVNKVAGNSLFDIHKRLNINCNSCFFPASYPKPGPAIAQPRAESGIKPLKIGQSGSGIVIQWAGQSKANAKVCSLDGKQLASFQDVGNQGVSWVPKNMSAGIYLVRFESENISRTERIFCGR